MKTIGITGAIASGVSTVCATLLEQGIPVVFADEVTHHLMDKNPTVRRALVTTFGKDIQKPDKSIDRHKLGHIIFQDSTARERLNTIMHPLIINAIENQLQEWDAAGKEWAGVDAPLLIESGFASQMDVVLLVTIDPKNQLERLMKRDQIDAEYAKAKISAQLTFEQKKEWLNQYHLIFHVIDNSGTPETTRSLVNSTIQAILRK